MRHDADDVLPVVYLKRAQRGAARENEVPPYQRLVRDLPHRPRRYRLGVYYFKSLLQICLAVVTAGVVVIKQMQSVELAVLGVYAVCGKSAAEPV